jgi:hypothetical protein
MRAVREQMQLLQQSIETKTDNIVREISPRIDQLEEKMQASWSSIEAMDKLSWEELQREKDVFLHCQKLVD